MTRACGQCRICVACTEQRYALEVRFCLAPIEVIVTERLPFDPLAQASHQYPPHSYGPMRSALGRAR